MTTDLAQRYGTPSRWQRWTVTGIAVLIAVTSLGWLLWATVFHSTPDAESTLIGFETTASDEITATVQVELADDVEEATCRLRAFAADHMPVGEVAFTPVDGDNIVVVRTERRATSIELLGCTTPDQKRPR